MLNVIILSVVLLNVVVPSSKWSSWPMTKRQFMTLPPGVNVIKLFSFVTTMRPNKLEGLSLETFSSQVLEFEGTG
jgi:hypothetical protein